MKIKGIRVFFLLLAAVFIAGACGDDDDDDSAGGGVCGDYCAAIGEDCMDGMTASECEQGCQLFVDDEACGAEYEAYMQCGVDNGVTCNEGFVEFTGCDAQEDAYYNCAFPEED